MIVDQRDQLIIREVAVKAAAEIYAGTQPRVDAVLHLAAQFESWICRDESAAAAVAPPEPPVRLQPVARVCPEHHIAKPSKVAPGQVYCPKRIETGEYCGWKADAA